MQRDLLAARKALKQSLKELENAEGDRSRLQKQVNKLSRTLEVSETILTHLAALKLSLLFWQTCAIKHSAW